jgi:squalene-hopene/tetraprenyl-beta-curcumene cyclase
MRILRSPLAAAALVVVAGGLAAAQAPAGTATPRPRPPASAATGALTRAAAPPASPDEPMAAVFSPQKAAAYLDGIALAWTRERKCGTCHTNYAYMMARPALGTGDPAVAREIRSFFEDKAATGSSTPPIPHALILAGVLAINDAGTTGHLHPATRQALDRMWQLQGPDGAWEYPTTFYSPPLGDSYYGAAFAAIGVGTAPDGYASTPAAQSGMEKLRRYLTPHAAPSLHHQTVLLWASTKTPGLLTAAQQAATIGELRALQHPDGGWSLRSLGDWKRRDGTLNDPAAPSDGYATGLIVYVLRQAGVPASDGAIARGVAWLRTHQRQSGRWFTFSINTDDRRDDNRYTDHLISNIGTAYAVMALQACGELHETGSR